MGLRRTRRFSRSTRSARTSCTRRTASSGDTYRLWVSTVGGGQWQCHFGRTAVGTVGRSAAGGTGSGSRRGSRCRRPRSMPRRRTASTGASMAAGRWTSFNDGPSPRPRQESGDRRDRPFSARDGRGNGLRHRDLGELRRERRLRSVSSAGGSSRRSRRSIRGRAACEVGTARAAGGPLGLLQPSGLHGRSDLSRDRRQDGRRDVVRRRLLALPHRPDRSAVHAVDRRHGDGAAEELPATIAPIRRASVEAPTRRRLRTCRSTTSAASRVGRLPRPGSVAHPARPLRRHADRPSIPARAARPTASRCRRARSGATSACRRSRTTRRFRRCS